MAIRFNEVIECFNSSNCKLISKEEDYKNTRSILEFICGECNNLSKMVFSTFKNGKPKMCADCRVKNRKFSRETNTRYTQELVEKLYEQYDCKFIDVYTYNNKTYKFQCKCGSFDEKLFYQFRKVPMCRNCAKKHADENRIISIEEVREYLESLGAKLVSDSYNGVKSKIEWVCKNGHHAFSTLDSIKSTNGRCKKCKIDSISGENNYKWKGGTYDDDSRKFRTTYEFKKWREDVYKRDNYTCQCCGKKGYINAHHKDGYNWCIERRTDISNGVTLCSDCHTEFHSIYGIGDNTESQFNEFYNNKMSLV